MGLYVTDGWMGVEHFPGFAEECLAKVCLEPVQSGCSCSGVLMGLEEEEVCIGE